MNGLDAKIHALRYAAKQVHAKEIIKHILTSNLWQATGNTPAYTVTSDGGAS